MRVEEEAAVGRREVDGDFLPGAVFRDFVSGYFSFRVERAAQEHSWIFAKPIYRRTLRLNESVFLGVTRCVHQRDACLMRLPVVW